MHKKLFIPGPVEVNPDVLEKMATPLIGHRTKDATALQQGISEKMQKVMATKNTIVLSTSSGSGLMEGAVRCFTAKRAAVFSIGAFGKRWYKMCTANGIPADIFESELGQITTPEMIEEALSTGKYDLITITQNETSTGIHNPMARLAEVYKKYPDVIVCVDTVSSMAGDFVPVDELGIDVCITSTQKCLGVPPGMAIAAVSRRSRTEVCTSTMSSSLSSLRRSLISILQHLHSHTCSLWTTSSTESSRKVLRTDTRDIRDLQPRFRSGPRHTAVFTPIPRTSP